MCGIFGAISKNDIISKEAINILSRNAELRGKDSSGLLYFDNGVYKVVRSNQDIEKLKRLVRPKSKIVLGHSRLITNGSKYNQPILDSGILVFHNGIVVNDSDIFRDLGMLRETEVDTEIINKLLSIYFEGDQTGVSLHDFLTKYIVGTVSIAALILKTGKLVLYSNCGSLYYAFDDSTMFFSSESYPLTELGLSSIVNVLNDSFTMDIDIASIEVKDLINDKVKHNLIPNLVYNSELANILKFRIHNLRRCTRCILPDTMPFILFDHDGVCNYCNNYKIRNQPKPFSDMERLIERYRRISGPECIVPFSGGRDSTWGLHIIVKELNLRPITYTYDWGMVTDLGRRNISRMCSQLGVENIIVADNIAKKRENIRKNLMAWLNDPNLGMISILTAGDKHFFRHVEDVKRRTGIDLNIWGVNPLEVTHFKSGFLGIAPDFAEERVYISNSAKQLDYQWKRFKAMTKSPGYFNNSIYDTVSGEYWRSIHKKNDYFHLFDFYKWEEGQCDEVLRQYNWEYAVDTDTSWRIGDGTAAFYNYLYYSIAGFTEHDTFRSNQIREGMLSRAKALELVNKENEPRYENIKWYLDALGLNFIEIITRVNMIKSSY